MASNLLIVESPAKSKTIGKFLGKDFQVLSSYGHIRDLKTKGMGVDIDNNFEPQYEVSEDKEKIVHELKSAAKKADKVWLASDEDREGEAIAWHLAEVLGLDKKAENRIVFHEITKSAVEQALAHPRAIDEQMVDAQQARRVLDRIVGFELSPVLWRKIRPQLSAGRVQSVAVRIIVEREREINAFESKSSFRIRGLFVTSNGEKFTAEVAQRPETEVEVKAILEALIDANYSVGKIEVKPSKRKPAAPFTTSTLQQEASRRMGYPVAQTMRLAQSLYEAGHITYMRTDSVNLSDYAIATSCALVEREYGKEYVKARKYKVNTKGAQEAHEAIRPTNVEVESAGANKQERALYEMIRKRTLASQMADAEMENTTVEILSTTPTVFEARGEVVKFEGFLKVYLEGNDDDEEREEGGLLPKMKKGNMLSCEEIEARERFNQRPARYTEASLVKRLEELGIGRPSTYAPTIQTIQKREYVVKKSIDGEKRDYLELKLKDGKISKRTKKEVYGADKNKLFPTDTGIVVTDFLVQHFPQVLDYNFTARVEEEFDNIAAGKKVWNSAIATFYDLFHGNVEAVMAEKSEHRVGERQLGEDPVSGEPVFAKIGRFGPMVQIGLADEGGKKPRFASIPAELSLETLTLEQALKLFDLPRILGEYQGEQVETNIGRFGPYVRFGKLFASIPKGMSAYEVTLEEAKLLIDAKIEQEKNKFIASFGEDNELVEVLNGRWGAYIKYKKSNYKIPKGTDVAKLTEADVRKIIADTDKAGGTKKRAKSKK
ncbi:MAG: type I DNA topoisomerase [Bacteroidales bacterium]|uniref:type I DNA topoisomerase n=1 Tax=Porphyromonas sp. TaxID=1924944 RepID=UPI00297255DF|nr:type I DNA topoisomerase [Porphyromonas sp.]MDD7438786.1 type I DNA topoisomerase [Bacteroidales bacterium]MDY3066786.1 type I DNA topoisomerase [Porphyromonas sp.]